MQNNTLIEVWLNHGHYLPVPFGKVRGSDIYESAGTDKTIVP